jgi:hypothetical protein
MSTVASPSLPAGLERRRARRVPVPREGGPVSVVGARLRDVSPYGMMIESPMALTVDAELPFRLVVAGEKADVEARVAVCTPLPGARRAFGVGLEFTRIDEAVRARLGQVLAGAGT